MFYKVLFHLQISTNFNACKNLVENFLKKNLAFHSRVLIFVWSVLLFDTFSVFAKTDSKGRREFKQQQN